jgi:hypothetical protein
MKRSIAVLLLLAVVLPMHAAKKKAAPTEPGKYKEWGDDIDQIEIVKGFKFADYSKIVVEPLDTASTPLPEKNDNTYGPVTAILPVATEKLIEGLREHVKVSVAGGEGAKDAGTLILRGKVTLMDPGSRAARYWASFGAGAARTEIECQIVDAASGDVLVRFKQERRSGFGVGGGSYESVLTRNLKQLGEDVASILGVF